MHYKETHMLDLGILISFIITMLIFSLAIIEVLFGFDFKLTSDESEQFTGAFDNCFNDSWLKTTPIEDIKTSHLVEVRAFYERMSDILISDFKDFQTKIDGVFKLFTFAFPVFLPLITHLYEGYSGSFSQKLIPIIISLFVLYIVYFFKVVRVNTIFSGYKTISNELPLQKQCNKEKRFLRFYIYNNASQIISNRARLEKIQVSIKGIHLKYILCSLFLAVFIALSYIDKIYRQP